LVSRIDVQRVETCHKDPVFPAWSNYRKEGIY